ncbi:MAG TPA: di-heme oxidoredictase family protein [Planctomycetota bacterium]|nr:di-heme oxidoredictase family protein [Planctomycetota bacterium]
MIFVLRRAWLPLALAGGAVATEAHTLEPQPPRERMRRGDVHTTGTAAWLIANDPERAAALGRALFQRSFTATDGASPPQAAPVLSAAKPLRLDFAPSCMQCHNVPFGEPGAGATTVRDAVTTRSTPHLFGAGQLDHLAAALSARLLALVDHDGDGTVGRNEMHGEAVIDNGSGQHISFGSFVDADGDGLPDLDPVVSVWFVTADGRRIAGGDLQRTDVVGYRFAVRAFGAGEAPHATAGTTLRAAIVGAFAIHAGLQAFDPVLWAAPADGGWAGIGAAGVRQVDAGALADLGVQRDAAGWSLDDPDRDGVCAELGDGDIDLVEWFLSQQRQPMERKTDPANALGRARFVAFGCAACHVPDWQVSNVSLSGLYSDLRSHDLGEAFHERQGDGRVLTHFRTTPLWGVAHSAPYGHDGASLDLDAVIRRHGGEAGSAVQAYEAAESTVRAEVLAFLATLVLTP